MVPAEDGKKGRWPPSAAVSCSTCSSVTCVRASLITREGLENAIAAGAMSGGSTNLVLHLLAVANEAGVRP